MVDLKNKVRKGTGRVAFLAHLEGIKKMIEAGHPLVSVYEEYESRLSIKSGQFGKYVRKYIRSKPNESKPAEERKIKKPESSDDRPRFKPSTPKLDDLV